MELPQYSLGEQSRELRMHSQVLRWKSRRICGTIARMIEHSAELLARRKTHYETYRRLLWWDDHLPTRDP